MNTATYTLKEARDAALAHAHQRAHDDPEALYEFDAAHAIIAALAATIKHPRLGERTIETHLGNIRAKLGFASRPDRRVGGRARPG